MAFIFIILLKLSQKLPTQRVLYITLFLSICIVFKYVIRIDEGCYRISYKTTLSE